MFSFITAAQNLPFTAAIGIMMGLAALELLVLMLGGSLLGLFDDIALDGADADIDLDVGDVGGAPSATGGMLGQILGWFAIGKVPFMIVLVAFLTIFGLLGLLLQSLSMNVTGMLMPASLASIPALIGGASTTRWVALGLARLIPSSETAAVSKESFIGRVAVITLGSASVGQAAQAKLQDQHGLTHYIMVEPDRDGVVFEQEDHVLLVGRAGSVFKAIVNQSDALIDQ